MPKSYHYFGYCLKPRCPLKRGGFRRGRDDSGRQQRAAHHCRVGCEKANQQMRRSSHKPPVYVRKMWTRRRHIDQICEEKMFCWYALALLTLVPVVTGNNAGVKVIITQRGLDYVAITDIKKTLIGMEIPEINGTAQIPVIGQVQYIAKGICILDRFKIQNLGNFESVVNFVAGTGVSINIKSADLYLSGNWTVRSNKIWLLEKMSALINLFGRGKIAEQICKSLKTAIAEYNNKLATLNANISEYAGIDYSLRSAVTSKTSIEFGLKGVFYNIQQRKEPPSPPTALLPLASQNTEMYCIAISAFTINSAFLVFHDAGFFNINITDDMVPSVSSILLSTTTFGAFIPQISQTYPDLKLELEVKSVKEPAIKFEPNNVIVQLFSTVTAVQSNTTTQLFVLNMKAIASVQVSVNKDMLVLDLTLEKIDVSMNRTRFKFTKHDFLTVVITDIVFPIIKAHLEKGFPLPGLLGSTIGKVHFVNPQVEVLKDYVLIGTDIQFTENTSS
ncbi:bactericidal permeability-increasing protein-like isoform X5 [Onychostoma macrolepis]|uniref:bactericidal permeability-increasing protein-like isoform X5 n=1 Tax=Onychostoma macrolepis TaxID=369639 RepID=UPI00272B65E4|nr:bactericidal permeability-increasing protein-like isoform X5 [Onychostoma macrolepis]